MKRRLREEVRAKTRALIEAISVANAYRYDTIDDPPYGELNRLEARLEKVLES